MPDPIKIRDISGRTKLIEFLVEKRVKNLEYLRALHTREGMLWMNTVRMGKTDIGRYFGLEDDVLDPHGKLRATRNKLVIRHHRTASAQQLASGNVQDVHINVMIPLRAIDGGTTTCVSDAWLEDRLPKFFTLGQALADLLLVPVGGCEFVDSFYQLMLELDVAYASSGAARVLASRALRNHRAAAVSYMDPTDSAAPAPAVASAKPHASSQMCIISETHLAMPFLPSYDIVVPALCSTLIFAYRKMCDYDAVENEDIVKLIVLVDRRIKSLFFGSISKELEKLAQSKVLQQAALLSENIFAAFTNADASLIDDLLKMRNNTKAASSLVAAQATQSAAEAAAAAVVDTDDD